MRLSAVESFRARTWRDIHHRQDAIALPNRAYRLLVGIVHVVLTPYNNGAITLGPATLRRLGMLNVAHGQDARDDLLAAGLLVTTTSPINGSSTHYALTFTPFTVEPGRQIKPTAGAVG
jgi:hypothetical protein